MILLPLDLGFFRPRPAVPPCAGDRVCARGPVEVHARCAPRSPLDLGDLSVSLSLSLSLSLLFVARVEPPRLVGSSSFCHLFLFFPPRSRSLSPLVAIVCEKRLAARVHREPEETTRPRGNLSTAGLDNVPFCPLGALLLCAKALCAPRAALVSVAAFAYIFFSTGTLSPLLPCVCGIVLRARASPPARKQGTKGDNQTESATAPSRDSYTRDHSLFVGVARGGSWRRVQSMQRPLGKALGAICLPVLLIPITARPSLASSSL